MNWLIARLLEPSTWRGIIWLLTALGVTLRPEIWEQVMAVGMAVAGLLGAITRDQKPALPPIELQGRVAADPNDPSIVNGRASSIPDGGYRVQSLQPDYQPKEPRQPVDYPPSGFNG